MIEDVKISQYENKDREGVLNCLRQVWRISEISEETIEKFLLNSNYLFVAKIEDKIIGCATLHLQQKLIRDGGIAGFIEDVVVSEEFRGLKIGEKLIKRLVEKSKELKCYKVTLSCFTERIDFYKRCGFFVENSTMRHNLQQ